MSLFCFYFISFYINFVKCLPLLLPLLWNNFKDLTRSLNKKQVIFLSVQFLSSGWIEQGKVKSKKVGEFESKNMKKEANDTIH